MTNFLYTLTNMTANVLTQGTTDCLPWSKLATDCRECNNAPKTFTEIISRRFTDKRQTKSIKIVDTHWTQHMEMSHAVTAFKGLQVWQNIPLEIRNSESLSLFKSNIKKIQSFPCRCKICRSFKANLGYID